LRRTTKGAADFEKGLEAYETGDYETTLKEFLVVPAQGDMVSQNWSIPEIVDRSETRRDVARVKTVLSI
jgi:hypothetical protein